MILKVPFDLKYLRWSCVEDPEKTSDGEQRMMGYGEVEADWTSREQTEEEVITAWHLNKNIGFKDQIPPHYLPLTHTDELKWFRGLMHLDPAVFKLI